MDLAGAWLLHSGIQEPLGGFARYYLANERENRPISTEITGYAISALVYLYTLTKDEQYLDAAARAGRFLTRLAWDSRLGLFPFEYSDAGGVEARAYFFDSGIIVRGLLRLWRVTGGQDLLDIAKACGRSMHRDFAAGDGEFHPILQLPGKEPVARSAQWSRAPGCYQLKAALAWLDLYAETAEGDYLAWYEETLEAALRTHGAFLPGGSGDTVMDRLHPYCYFLEGILPRAERREVATALVEGMARTAEHIQALAPQFLRSDVCAQLLRVQLLADRAGVETIDRLRAHFMLETIETFQLEHLDLRIHGGFFFARRGPQLQAHVNPVSTVFGLQTIAMWRQYVAGDLTFSPEAVI